MRRRELLSALVPVTLAVTGVVPVQGSVNVADGAVDGIAKKALATIPRGHYMLFVDSDVIDIAALASMESPEGVTMDIIPLRLSGDQTIHDAVAIYKIPNEPETPSGY